MALLTASWAIRKRLVAAVSSKVGDGGLFHKLAGDPMPGAHLGGEFFERGGQPAGSQRHQAQPARHVTSLGNGGAEQLGDFHRVGGFGQGEVAQLGRQLAGGEGGADQVLAQAVVQVLAEATLLPVAGFSDLAFELLAGADVGEDDNAARSSTGGIPQGPAGYRKPDSFLRVGLGQEHLGLVHRLAAHGAQQRILAARLSGTKSGR